MYKQDLEDRLKTLSLDYDVGLHMCKLTLNSQCAVY